MDICPNTLGNFDEAIKYVSKLLLPKVINGRIVLSYIRKGIRVGVWRFLSPESRALLKILTRWRSIRSRTLRNIVAKIFLQIELSTLRGKALLYGAILAIRSNLRGLLNSTTSLLYLGISYLSNPPIFKFLT